MAGTPGRGRPTIVVTVMNTEASRINAKQIKNGSRQDRHTRNTTTAMIAVAMTLTPVSASNEPHAERSSPTGVRRWTSQPARS